MEYVEKNLVKITKLNDEVKYYAVDENTCDNMIDSSSAIQYIPWESKEQYDNLQFKAEFVGNVFVQI